MSTTNTNEAGLRLLDAVYDLSGGKLNEPVSIDGPEGAAARAGLESRSVDRDLAVRYLLDQDYVRAAEPETSGEKTTYNITVTGLDRARRMHGLEPEPQGGIRLAGPLQKVLLKSLSITLAYLLARPLTNRLIDVPERRGISDDVKEALLKGTARAIAIFAASIIVRRLTEGMK